MQMLWKRSVLSDENYENNVTMSDVRNVMDDVTSTLLEATPRQQSGTTPAGRSVHDIAADALGLVSRTTRFSARSASTTTRGAIRSTEAGMVPRTVARSQGCATWGKHDSSVHSLHRRDRYMA